ncbi:MAG TPA: hypothetical protein VFG89_04170 [Coriobacteriia bacterium]|nr:hypothetical protein [Coriobacteriia bacterium]
MGLFGPSLTERIRRSAAKALPQATWTIDVDWSTGVKLHQLHGTLPEQHTDSETMQYAKDVWTSLVGSFRLDPKDGHDGLVDVGVTSLGGVEQLSGVNG